MAHQAAVSDPPVNRDKSQLPGQEVGTEEHGTHTPGFLALISNGGTRVKGSEPRQNLSGVTSPEKQFQKSVQGWLQTYTWIRKTVSLCRDPHYPSAARPPAGVAAPPDLEKRTPKTEAAIRDPRAPPRLLPPVLLWRVLQEKKSSQTVTSSLPRPFLKGNSTSSGRLTGVTAVQGLWSKPEAVQTFRITGFSSVDRT
ncbi:hypothetical protein TREES_T100021670 [Tupaia chinensis]|uniref:Uncharacterized protein n=1 Tax=Tupaia chinensis TaxID=246437 RepID=L9JLV1_TUPCH|nr:hypothetical protein TREES_T100021670 [Tupaia chinensis]